MTPTIPLSELRPLIDWTYYYWAWRVKADTPEGEEVRHDAEDRLDRMMAAGGYDVRYSVVHTEAGQLTTALGTAPCRRWLTPDYPRVGLFAATISERMVGDIERLKSEGIDDYEILLLQLVGDRLVEAASEWIGRRTGAVIRPAVGYPALPDQRFIFQMARHLDYPATGIQLTENGAMYPPSSVSGLLIYHPEAKY